MKLREAVHPKKEYKEEGGEWIGANIVLEWDDADLDTEVICEDKDGLHVIYRQQTNGQKETDAWLTEIK